MLLHGLSGNDSLAHKDVDQSLQRLHVLAAQQIVVHSHRGKMHKTTVQLQMPVDVPEWILPMAMVQMRIAAKHLLDDASDVRVEIAGEAG